MATGERQRENWVADICGALKLFVNVARIRYRCVLVLSSALMLRVGQRTFTAITRVQIPSGTPTK